MRHRRSQAGATFEMGQCIDGLHMTSLTTIFDGKVIACSRRHNLSQVISFHACISSPKMAVNARVYWQYNHLLLYTPTQMDPVLPQDTAADCELSPWNTSHGVSKRKKPMHPMLLRGRYNTLLFAVSCGVLVFDMRHGTPLDSHCVLGTLGTLSRGLSVQEKQVSVLKYGNNL